MRVPRRLVPLLACALIAGAPAVAHAQGGAGDDQYQDPFAGSGSSDNGGGGASNSGSQGGGSQGGTGTSSQGTATPDTGSTAPPAQAPATSSDSSSSAAPAPAPAPATSSSTAAATGPRSELPRTGFDAPVVALLGIGLLAAGLGLRLRVAHGRRS